MKKSLESVTNAETFHEIRNTVLGGWIKGVWTPSSRQILPYFKLKNATSVDIPHGTLLKFNCVTPQAEQAEVAESLSLSEMVESLFERSSTLRCISKFLSVVVSMHRFSPPLDVHPEKVLLSLLCCSSAHFLCFPDCRVLKCRDSLKMSRDDGRLNTVCLAELSSSSQDMFTLSFKIKTLVSFSPKLFVHRLCVSCGPQTWPLQRAARALAAEA